MKTYGLIGYPLSHSFSQKFFTEKFLREGLQNHRYELYPIKNINSITNLIANDPTILGINVTIPHKMNVLPFLDEISEVAKEIGAVNCVCVKKCGGEIYLKGYNTDVYGFEESLKPLLETHHTKALVFGDGGATKAIKYVLKRLNIDFIIVVRKKIEGTVLYQDLSPEIIQSHTLLINTTPLGMSPNVDTYPEIDYSSLGSKHLAYDIVYNPLETAFLSKAAVHGAKIKNGMEMLCQQAEKAWEIWNS